MSNIFAGNTYVWTSPRGVKRTLAFLTENGADQTITATWQARINRVPVAFEMSGSYVKWDTNHNRWLFTLSGHAEVFAQDRQDPAIRFACNSLTGYGDGGSATSLPDTLQITVAWAKDIAGLAESTGAREARAFDLIQAAGENAA